MFKHFTAPAILAGTLCLAALPAAAQNVLLESNFWKGADLAKVEAAVDAGADPLATDAGDYFPLWLALRAGTTIDVVDYFVAKGEDINQVGNDNLSPLMLAARFNTIDVVNHMLTMDVDLGFQDDSWRDALGFACLIQTDKAVYEALMAKGMDPKIRDIHGRNCALSAAYLNRSVETISYIATIDDIKAVDNNGSNAFHQAAFRNPSLDVIKAMKDVVDDPMAVNKDGNTALHLSAIRQKDPSVQAWLISEGFDVAVANAKGETPLHIAVRGNTAEVVSGLIAAGADVNARDAEGNTPLALAQSRDGADDVVKALSDAGAM